MKYLAKAAMAVMGVLMWCTTTNAQTISIGPDQYAFQYSVNPNFGLFFNATDGRYEFRDGAAAPVLGFSATSGALTTNLSFSSGSDLLIGNNRYAFRAASNPNYGLFFNGTTVEYQFLNSSAAPIFAVNANNGNARVSGGLRVGNSGLAQAGNIRWTGTDFQGYNGSSWASLTTGPAGPQGPPGPQGPAGLLPAGGTNSVPYYDGSNWIVSVTNLTNNGTSVGIAAIPPTNSRLLVNALSNDAVANRSVIEADRIGLPGVPGPLTSWGNADAALFGDVNWGNSYSAAVLGESFLDYENSASVLGTNNAGTIFGGLAYRTDDGLKAGYFEGDVETTGRLQIGGVDFNENPTVYIADHQSGVGDSLGLKLQGTGNYLALNNWVFGESDGAGEALLGDMVFSRFGNQEYIMWSGYFAPARDDENTLGLVDQRWSTIYSSNGTINTSDARDKKNIEELDYGLETLMKLKPVSYEWNHDDLNVGTKLGFVAQDLLEVVPEVVVTKEKVENRETGEVTFEEAERYGVFYDDLIPVLTKAIQEQQGTIEELTAENEELKNRLEDVMDRMDLFEQDLQSCCFSSQSSSEIGGNNADSQDAELGQNIPNPFSESTIIRYYLPDGVNNAIIRITDMEGSPVEDVQLGIQRGTNQIEFQTQGFASGTYLYTLFVDGKFIDTKKMMIAR